MTQFPVVNSFIKVAVDYSQNSELHRETVQSICKVVFVYTLHELDSLPSIL